MSEHPHQRFEHLPLDQVRSTDLPAPTLDFVEFTFDGVTFRAFGLLHGVTGGMNREYRRFARDGIRTTPGAKLGEKGMKALYRGCRIDRELDDWLVLRASDCFFLGLQLVLDPRCLRMVTLDAVAELLRSRDPFIADQQRSVSALGESPYFHHLDPTERRDLIGFPTPPEALSRDLGLLARWWQGVLPWQRPLPIDNARWRRILLMRRFMHIPARSLHMLRFAHAHAKQRGIDVVNLFVGETHNTDMLSFAREGEDVRRTLGDREGRQFDRIVRRAQRFGGISSPWARVQLVLLKLRYVLLITAGACAGTAIYVALVLLLIRVLGGRP